MSSLPATKLRMEEKSAISIQRYWRGFRQYSHYVITIVSALRHFVWVRVHYMPPRFSDNYRDYSFFPLV